MLAIALYARVSSEKQVQLNTIDSQVAALESRIKQDGFNLLDSFKFIDNGYSGSNLTRPALERLRDQVARGEIDKIYIHSPDRLSRKYAYQMILLEEFQKGGAETIFLNHSSNESPESQLLLQMQGMIAEYERAKIMERYRRGKIHAAQKGSTNILGGAPYGYRYRDKYVGGGQAFYEVQPEEAEVVQKIFSWIAHERLTIGEVCRRLKNHEILSPKGKPYWDRSVIWALLKNPAYIGQAAFGKTKTGALLPRIKPQKHSREHPRKNSSVYRMQKEHWIYIPVPSIVDEATFEIVQGQLEENKRSARARRRGAAYLLQGLIMCPCCHYSYYGKPVRNKRGHKIDRYAYYRCIGTDGYRFGGEKICNNQQIRTDVLEEAVWGEVKYLLKDPTRVLNEYQQRIEQLKEKPLDQTRECLKRQEDKLKRGVSRLIDSYTQEHIEKEEFEPRIKMMKERLDLIEKQKQEILCQQNLHKELTLVLFNLKTFAADIESKLETIDWMTKRQVIRMLVKRVEIGQNDVNIVFRVPGLSDGSEPVRTPPVASESLQHCNRGD